MIEADDDAVAARLLDENHALTIGASADILMTLRQGITNNNNDGFFAACCFQ